MAQLPRIVQIFMCVSMVAHVNTDYIRGDTISPDEADATCIENEPVEGGEGGGKQVEEFQADDRHRKRQTF
ncbi:hypothetical protein LshimejAT787_1200870 [Lyophyllum shimeji]|uniref:Secreted protein n=1 Tax=Lyophyllum shimeji TaxID=47721 RepID=A0A9P3URG2_LYOSH|nr:hypothetical protein LshimejAT787_1200870 [Lyophyllum shimeji]